MKESRNEIRPDLIAQQTYSLADIHVTTVFDDDLALLGCGTISHRFDVFVDDELLSDLWSHWPTEFLYHHENDEEYEQRESEADGEDDVGNVGGVGRASELLRFGDDFFMVGR